MRSHQVMLMVALSSSLAWVSARAEMPDSDPKAIQVADQVMKALGGKDKWDALPGLRWTFESASGDTMLPGGRRHTWNKLTGWHRVEGKNRRGQSYVIVNSLDHPEQGKAWMDGTAIEGDSLQKLLKRAKSLWTNDTYWMLMPYKLRDQGVHLKYDGVAKQGGVTYDKLALSFENVGETPGDRYWVFVNRANHRVEKWEFVLQSDQPPAKNWTWEGYEQHGGLWFPTAHRSTEMTLYTHAVETMTEFPAQAFSAP